MKRIFHFGRRVDTAATDVHREIETHLALRTREFEARGMTPDEARRAALESFGDRAAIESEVRDLRTTTIRARRRRDWLADIGFDVRVGLRGLRRAPIFTTIALLTLAIGIGANTAVFSVVRSVLLRPLPYPDADQLVQVWSDHRALGRATPEWLTPPDFIDWRDGNTTFASMAAYSGWLPNLTGIGDPEALSGAVVSGNYFEVLGTRPAAGRLLTMADDNAGAEQVVVLSDALWRRRFGSDSTVIGKPIQLNGMSWTVIGVLPASFRAPFPGRADIFRATRRPANAGCGRGCIVLRVIGRLKPGISIDAAHADLSRIASRIATEFPETNAKVGVWLIPLHEQITGPAKSALLTLTAAVGLVLLIGCVNIANLLLVRGAGRTRELGVRAALGAGNWRIARQLLTENAVLAVTGGVIGIALGIAASRLLSVLVPPSVSAVQDIRVDGRVLLFSAAITMLAGFVFGLIPALGATRPGVVAALRSGARETGRRGNLLRGGLATAQLSFAVVLLFGAGLLLRSFALMQRVDLGFRTDDALVTNVAFPQTRYRDAAASVTAAHGLLERLRANPAIRAAEVTDVPPFSGGDQDMTVVPVGEPETNQPPAVWYRSVSHGYISTMQMRLVAGRQFNADDRAGAPMVGIVNEEAARRFWHGQNPIGRVLSAGESPDAPKLTVVGVVASDRHDGPSSPFKAELFIPFDQFPARQLAVVIDPAGDRENAVNALRGALKETDPLIPFVAPQSMRELAGTAVSLPRMYATLIGIFAGAALLLAVLGVYGVIAYAVSQRQREIGVRLALGAAPSNIGRMVLRQGGLLAVLGIVIGTVAALILGRLIETLLFGVTPRDSTTLVAVAITLGAMTLLASWIPARRAMKVDPLAAIRND